MMYTGALELKPLKWLKMPWKQIFLRIYMLNTENHIKLSVMKPSGFLLISRFDVGYMYTLEVVIHDMCIVRVDVILNL